MADNETGTSDTTSATTSDPSKVTELVRVLDDYFEVDENLRKEYENPKSVVELRKLKLVKALNPDEETLLGAIEQCKKLSLEENRTKVRANVTQGRTMLILRDLAEGTTYEQIKKLLESEELVSQLESRVKEIKPDHLNTWFVRFASQDDCMTAAFWLNTKGMINGQKVKCRVKSVLPSSTYNPPPQQGFMDPYQNPHAGQQGFYGYPPSPNFMGFPPSPNFGAQRQGSRRKRSQKNNRQKGGLNRQGSTHAQYGRQSSNRAKGGRQKSMRGGKPQIQPDGNIHYEGQFVMVERNTFDAIVKSARNADMNEPIVPEALAAFPPLLTESPKAGFDLKPLTTGSTISPMPVPQTPSNGAPPYLNLSENGNGGKKEKKKKGKKKNSSAEAPVEKAVEKAEDVDIDDKKEEEIVDNCVEQVEV